MDAHERDAAILSLESQVKIIAAKVHRNLLGISKDDLISEGWIGAINAVDRWNPDRATLRTFAERHIHGAMLDYLRSLWQSKRGKWMVVGVDCLRWTADPRSAAGFRQVELRRYFDALKPRERQVLERYDLAGETLWTIARGLGVNDTRVSQIRSAALAKLRAARPVSTLVT